MAHRIEIFKHKEAYINILLNFLATGVSLGILEVLIYPLLARRLSIEEYGQMQTIISIIYLFGATLGQALSTTRLVKQFEYTQKKYDGDYNFLLLVSIPIAVIITTIICKFYFVIKNSSLAYISIITLLICAEAYYEVGFQLELNYKKVLYCRVIACIGYIVGFLVFLGVGRWEMIFIGSYLCQLFYCLSRTGLVKEKYSKTKLFGKTVKSYLSLIGASGLSKSLVYFDKLILYPLLGGEAVSIYFTANLLGKLILKVLEPVNNVFLSYLAKREKVSGTIWKTALLVGAVVCVGGYFACMAVGKPILNLFYPEWTEAALGLLPLTTATLCISSLTSILYPFSLKMIKTIYQCLINGISLIIYVMLALVLIERYTLVGSCIALLISYLIKLAIMIILCFKAVVSADIKV